MALPVSLYLVEKLLNMLGVRWEFKPLKVIGGLSLVFKSSFNLEWSFIFLFLAKTDVVAIELYTQSMYLLKSFMNSLS